MDNLSPDQLDITEEDLAIVLDILEQHVPERAVWAFGSRVTGRARPFSDLDLVLVDNTPLSFAQMADLVEAFDQSDLPFKVDIVDWARTDETFKEIIRKTKIVLRANGKSV
jgi:hypothetical protein